MPVLVLMGLLGAGVLGYKLGARATRQSAPRRTMHWHQTAPRGTSPCQVFAPDATQAPPPDVC